MAEVDLNSEEMIPAERAAAVPVKHSKDYSDLPQKTIKLKQGIGGLAGPLADSADTPLAAGDGKPVARTPTQRYPVKKPRKSATQWTLRGISTPAREAALNAAKEQGIPVGRWLERAIFQALAPTTKSENAQTQVLEVLADIQARLERIEQGPAWLVRLKQYLKTWWG
jgi:hypothetical protein